jgi:hypothetical protein
MCASQVLVAALCVLQRALLLRAAAELSQGGAGRKSCARRATRGAKIVAYHSIKPSAGHSSIRRFEPEEQVHAARIAIARCQHRQGATP